jgi:hypothetical protein
MPSRIPPLISELLEVLISVISPPSTSPAPSFSPTLQTLRASLDPTLITQELVHGVFEPQGLFRLIGDTLKCHCAPMRDRAVEGMVEYALKGNLVKAIRTCFEILELMKLVCFCSALDSSWANFCAYRTLRIINSKHSVPTSSKHLPNSNSKPSTTDTHVHFSPSPQLANGSLKPIDKSTSPPNKRTHLFQKPPWSPRAYRRGLLIWFSTLRHQHHRKESNGPKLSIWIKLD